MNIIQDDSIHAMQAMVDGCVDAIVTDPPYCSGSVSESSRTAAKGQGLRGETIKKLGWFVGDNMGTAGLVYLLRETLWNAKRLLKPNGSALVFCDWRMVSNLAPAIESCGYRFQNLIVWDKGSMGLGSGFRAQHEMILHFTNGAPKYHDRGTPNVIRCKRVAPAEREHQTQKPVDLIEQLIRVVCPPGGVVLDPFAGSCTTAVAAINTDRDFVCIERDINYVNTGWGRVVEAMAIKSSIKENKNVMV